MPNDDREQRFDHALARHLPNASPDSACPDAEILAAYHERTLSTEEISQWKEHIAGCSRCQETLALVEPIDTLPAHEWEHQDELHPVGQLAAARILHLTDGAAQEAPKPVAAEPPTDIALPVSKTRSRAAWQWLVPVGAIAACVIVWIGAREVHSQHQQQAYETKVAQNRLSIPQLPAQAEPRATLQKEAPAPKPDELAPPRKKTISPVPKVLSPQRDSTLLASGAASNSGDTTAALNEREDLRAGAAGAVAPKPSAPFVSGYTERGDTRARVASPNRMAAAHAKPKSAADAKEKSDNSALTTAETVQIQAAAPTDAISNQVGLTAPKETAGLLQVAAGDRRFVVAPGETHAWHLGSAGQIAYTSDHGKTWQPQTTGVIADLTAGSATSDQVCWVVGKAGTVLLTKDGGKHWEVLSSPITDDLGGVHATDVTHASIWDVPNRRSYQTSDGGLSWQRSANE
jgi:hypothetical protein